MLICLKCQKKLFYLVNYPFTTILNLILILLTTNNLSFFCKMSNHGILKLIIYYNFIR